MNYIVPRVSSDLFNWMDDFFNTNQSGLEQRNHFPLQYDVEETPTHYLLSFDAPGVEQKDLRIEVEANHLLISGERRANFEDKNKRYVERRFGKFQKSFQLPNDVKVEAIEANFKNGVLQVAVPKAESEKAKRIEIQTDNKGLFSRLLQRDKDSKQVN